MPEPAAIVFTSAELRGAEPALAVRRGALRLLHALGFAAVAELPLGSGRRADIVALGESGEFWIVEKWQEYRLYSDRFLFAVTPEFPANILPADAGLLIADAYGGTLLREGPLHPLAAARRKAMLIRFGRAAAARLNARLDPGLSESALL